MLIVIQLFVAIFLVAMVQVRAQEEADPIPGCELIDCFLNEVCDCTNYCPATCENLNPTPCPTLRCEPGCICEKGFVLNKKGGQCIPIKDCKKWFPSIISSILDSIERLYKRLRSFLERIGWGQTPQCKKGEVYDTCPTCPPTCNNTAPICAQFCRDPTCVCERGLVRDGSGKCVNVDECPKG